MSSALYEAIDRLEQEITHLRQERAKLAELADSWALVEEYGVTAESAKLVKTFAHELREALGLTPPDRGKLGGGE